MVASHKYSPEQKCWSLIWRGHMYGTTPISIVLFQTGLFPHVNTAYNYLAESYYDNLTTLCLNGTLSGLEFMDVFMGDTPQTETQLATCQEAAS